MTTWMKWCFVAVLGLFVLACQERPDVPVDPVWGKEKCAHCAMLVGDRAYAAQVTTKDGARLYFDDIGCMVQKLQEGEVVVDHAWVHHETEPVWLDATHARYRHGARTPMDSGFSATREEQGTVSYSDMIKRVMQKRAEGGGHGHH
ncbi:MAG: hypothetical protein AB2A00_32460 [Myxococcota bacterium]